MSASTEPVSFPEGLNPPPRKPLAQLPTPLEYLKRTSEDLGASLWVKRDDLTGTALTGNKVRKLEYLIAEAEQMGAKGLVTCGGVNSNHARAVALSAARLGWSAHLLLRGQERHPPQGNLLLDQWVGANITFVNPEAYAQRTSLMADIATREGNSYVIPEGGSNGLGALGYVRCAIELAHQVKNHGIRLSRVVHACGSGGTTAGLALGFAALGMDVDLLSVAVSQDAAHFNPIIQNIIDETVHRSWVAPSLASKAKWRVLEGYVGRGYAQTSPEEMITLRRFARKEGLVVDPVYTGKALIPIVRGDLPPIDGATVFLHTGGIFELFQFAEDVTVAVKTDV